MDACSDCRDGTCTRDFDQRLRAAYATAMQQVNASGRVQIHLGKNVIEYLRSFAIEPNPLAAQSLIWGFMVVPLPDALANHIEVHTVWPIP